MLDSETYELDPVYLHSLREAKVILVVFAIFAAFVLNVAFGLGYEQQTESNEPISTVFGIPSWVFWSIVLPWIAANVVTGWFCFRFLRTDPLEDLSAISGEAINVANGLGESLSAGESGDDESRRGQNEHE